ncbi:MAG: RNA-directed DNA polymerase [Bacteroidales bacterium]|nr:RNA-directed DNA polymerase [Bacteroidales bacterium]
MLYKKNCGLPIGNLTSQLFSNLYLHPLDCYVKNDLGMTYYGRYVDDFIIIHRDKEELKMMVEKINKFLKDKLQLELHPRKIYLQHFSKGVNFLGATIKPYRNYIANRTKKNFARCIHYWNCKLLEKEPSKEELARMRASINSYLGAMVHYCTFNIRKKYY